MTSSAAQTALFETRITNGFRDPAFSKNREVPLHRWVPWVAGFSAQFVQDCLDKFVPKDRRSQTWVLDPFAGVGTTLVEAYLRGLNVIGFEINPYAALAARLKLEARQVPAVEFARRIEAFEKHMERRELDHDAEPHSKPPSGFSGRTRLFSPKVERKILFALDFVGRIEDSRIRDLFRLALGSVMVSMSNYSYEPSLTRRSAVGKPDIGDASVDVILSKKLRLMLDDIEWMKEVLHSVPRIGRGEVIPASIFAAQQHLKRSAFVNLVVTSPPYLNNYHYPRNTRPQLHWLGFASGKGYNGAYENESFGKFWQTVRSSPPVDLSFEHRRLENIVETLRGLNADEGQYGGAGWANYVATYFNDAYRFCRLLSRLLRSGGTAVVVLGNSIIQGLEIKTDQLFGETAELCGLAFKDTMLLRRKRTGSSIIQSSVRVDKAATKVVLYESAIVLKKKK
jgi:DNA modification methylase